MGDNFDGRKDGSDMWAGGKNEKAELWAAFSQTEIQNCIIHQLHEVTKAKSKSYRCPPDDNLLKMRYLAMINITKSRPNNVSRIAMLPTWIDFVPFTPKMEFYRILNYPIKSPQGLPLGSLANCFTRPASANQWTRWCYLLPNSPLSIYSALSSTYSLKHNFVLRQIWF